MTPTDREIYALATHVYHATKYQKWQAGVASDLAGWRSTGLQREVEHALADPSRI